MEVAAPELSDFARYRVEPEERFSLADHDPADTDGLDGPDEVAREYEEVQRQIVGLQERRYAEEERSLLVVLQGIDAAGKDGAVKHVLRGTNPTGVRVYSFKEPSSEELAHDFLWRYHQATPDDYQRAYEEAVSATSTAWAPWYVVPADNRWFRNYVIARVLAGTLQAMGPCFPAPPEDVKRFAERELER